MNKKGQALVEFIIILPILIFIMLAIIDYGMISYNKTKMENLIADVAGMYKNNESEEEIKDFIHFNDKNIKTNISYEDKYINLLLSKKYDYITPGLNKLFKINEITIERKIYNE